LKLVLERRAASVWTRIHPVFALAQLLVFFVSVSLLIAYLLHAVPYAAVHASVLVKIGLMVGAVVTGALWEHDVYHRWWFAHEFIIEDTMTANVFILHIGYLVVAYVWPANGAAMLSMLAVAYGAYALNVGQYIVQHRSSMHARKADRADDEMAA
jgi:3-vinyl bacteriochlorophyllide hydratase